MIACLAAVLLSATASARTIKEDNGGRLETYWDQVQAAAHVKEKIRFDGPCRSACTLFLLLPERQLCATPRVQFWFHQPYGGDTPQDDREAVQFMATHYPKWVRGWLRERGGLKKEFMIMEPSFILAHMRKC